MKLFAGARNMGIHGVCRPCPRHEPWHQVRPNPRGGSCGICGGICACACGGGGGGGGGVMGAACAITITHVKILESCCTPISSLVSQIWWYVQSGPRRTVMQAGLS